MVTFQPCQTQSSLLPRTAEHRQQRLSRPGHAPPTTPYPPMPRYPHPLIPNPPSPTQVMIKYPYLSPCSSYHCPHTHTHTHTHRTHLPSWRCVQVKEAQSKAGCMRTSNEGKEQQRHQSLSHKSRGKEMTGVCEAGWLCGGGGGASQPQPCSVVLCSRSVRALTVPEDTRTEPPYPNTHTHTHSLPEAI